MRKDETLYRLQQCGASGRQREALIIRRLIYGLTKGRRRKILLNKGTCTKACTGSGVLPHRLLRILSLWVQCIAMRNTLHLWTDRAFRLAPNNGDAAHTQEETNTGNDNKHNTNNHGTSQNNQERGRAERGSKLPGNIAIREVGQLLPALEGPLSGPQVAL